MTRRKRSRRAPNGHARPYRRADGQWAVAISIGGKRIIRYGATEEEVKLKLDQLRNQLRLGTPIRSRASTVVTVTDWVQQQIPADASPVTRQLAQHSLKHFEAHLGHRPLHELQSIEVMHWLSQTTGIGSRARQMAFDLLKRSLKAAVGKLIDKNPCDGIARPKYTRKPIRPFTVNDVSRLLTAARPHRLYAAFALILLAGLRQEEVFGAEWSAIDWRDGILTIRQTATRTANGGIQLTEATKTDGSFREIPLPAPIRRALFSRARVAVTEKLGNCSLICPSRHGTPMSSCNFAYKTLKPLLAQLEIDPRGLHHGRHAVATFLLRGGTPLHIVSKILGHSSPRTTSIVYSHVLTGDVSSALDALSAQLSPPT